MILGSCNSIVKNERAQNENPLIGDWSGHELFWSQDGRNGNGGMDWDYRITADSIFIFNYPTKFKSAQKIEFLDDSIKFDNGLFKSTYKWNIKDSLLSVSGKTYFGNSEGTDSMIFIKDHFDDLVLSNIQIHGFNTNILEQGIWIFDLENTKKHRWKSYDTSFYNPPKTLNFNAAQDYFLKYNTVSTAEDTFKINYLDKKVLSSMVHYWLEIEKIVGRDTIILSYDNSKN